MPEKVGSQPGYSGFLPRQVLQVPAMPVQGIYMLTQLCHSSVTSQHRTTLCAAPPPQLAHPPVEWLERISILDDSPLPQHAAKVLYIVLVVFAVCWVPCEVCVQLLMLLVRLRKAQVSGAVQHVLLLEWIVP